MAESKSRGVLCLPLVEEDVSMVEDVPAWGFGFGRRVSGYRGGGVTVNVGWEITEINKGKF